MTRALGVAATKEGEGETGGGTVNEKEAKGSISARGGGGGRALSSISLRRSTLNPRGSAQRPNYP